MLVYNYWTQGGALSYFTERTRFPMLGRYARQHTLAVMNYHSNKPKLVFSL